MWQNKGKKSQSELQLTLTPTDKNICQSGIHKRNFYYVAYKQCFYEME